MWTKCIKEIKWVVKEISIFLIIKSILSICGDKKYLDMEFISSTPFKNPIKQEIMLRKRSNKLKITRFDINKFSIDVSNHYLVPEQIDIIKEACDVSC